MRDLGGVRHADHLATLVTAVEAERASDVHGRAAAQLAQHAEHARASRRLPDDGSETEPTLSHRPQRIRDARIWIDPQHGKSVMAAAHAGHARGTDLVHVHACGGQHDGGSARDIDCLQAIHADAHEAQMGLGRGYLTFAVCEPLRVVALGDAQDLGQGLAFGPQRRNERPLLQLGLLIAPDL